MARFIGKLRNRMRNLSGQIDRYQEVITFAEAGHQEHAEEVLQESHAQEEETRKLVVVGKESQFSNEIIDYAIDMAERMKYEIVALNTAPLSCETFQKSTSKDKIFMDFQMLAEQSARPFRKEAQRRGISFTHVVKFSESYEVLAELRKEIGEFEFVVSEEESNAASSRTRNGEQPKQEIFVYSML